MRISIYLIILALCTSCLYTSEDVNSNVDVAFAGVRHSFKRAARIKLDFLFVIDNSGSMCEEQERLANNFQEFSNFLFDELQDAADYKIAVTSTDMQHSKRDLEGTAEAEDLIRGRFLYRPSAPNNIQSQCNGNPPPTADCFDPSGQRIAGEPIISSLELEALSNEDLGCAAPCSEDQRKALLKARLQRDFKCRATVEPTGLVFEKGLEAMRYSLSCKGPNADKLAPCCENLGTDDAYYNPACVIEPGEAEPEFLRPDATLIVIFLSDESDCSVPADFPETSSRLICRPDGLRDENNDGFPDIYTRDCGGLDPQTCYQNECKDLGPDECRDKRCDIKHAADMECEWYRGRLTPIIEYRDFLQSLKANPLDQLLVAPIVGFRSYTEAGNELSYKLASTTESEECDNDYDSSNLNLTKELCCPGGVCSGIQQISPVCDDSDRGIRGWPGTRYLQLADELGDNGLGCSPGSEPEVEISVVSDENNESKVLRRVVTTNNECLTICEEDFVRPLNAIKDQLARQLNRYCIPNMPVCIVPAQIDELGNIVNPEHACETVEEFGNVNHYSTAIQVSKECLECRTPFPKTNLLEGSYCESISDDFCFDVWDLKIHKTSILSQIPNAIKSDFEIYMQMYPEITSFIKESITCPVQIEMRKVLQASTTIDIEMITSQP